MAAVTIISNLAGQFFISLNLPTINCRFSGRLQPSLHKKRKILIELNTINY